MAKRDEGRATLLTPQLSDEICRAIAAGVSIDDAAASVGISARTIHYWRAAGRALAEGDTEGTRIPRTRVLRQRVVQFFHDFERARVEGRLSAATTIRNLMSDSAIDPRVRLDAARFYLERTDPDHWGRQRLSADASGSITFRVVYEEAAHGDDHD